MFIILAQLAIIWLLTAGPRLPHFRRLPGVLRNLRRDERGLWDPRDAFKDIANAIGAIFDTIKDAFLSAFDWLKMIGDLVATLIAQGVSTVEDTLTWLTTSLINVLSDGLGAIRDTFQWLTTTFLNTFVGAANAVQNTFSWLTTVFVNTFSSGVGAIRDILAWLTTTFLNTFGSAAGAVRDLVTWFLTQFVNTVSSVGGAIRDLVTWFASQFVNIVTSTAGAVVDRVQFIAEAIFNAGKAVENLGQDIAVKGIEEATGHKRELIELLLGLGVPGGLAILIVDEILQHTDVADKLSFAGKGAVEFGKDAAAEAIGLLTAQGRITPGTAPIVFAEIIAAQTAIGFVTHGLAVAKSFVPTLGDNALSRLAVMLHSLTGYEETVAKFYEPAIHAALGRPMEQLVNSQTITNIPGEGVLSELLGRRDIADSLYDDQLGFHGFRPFWRTVFEPSSFRPARIFELARIMQFTDIGDDLLDEMLQTASYPDKTIEALRPTLKAVALSRANGRLQSEAMEAYQKGFIDSGTFAGVLAFAGVKPTEAAQWVSAAGWAYSNEVKSELLTAHRAAAARDALTDDELRVGLAGIGVTGAKADVEVQRANIARLRKPVDDVDAATRRAVNAARSEYITAYKLQFRKGLIDATQLRNQLVFVGIPAFQADAIVTLAQAETYQPPAIDRANSPEAVSMRIHAELQQAYILQFQHDLIDAGALRSSLVAIGVNDFEASAIVAREQARKTPSPTEISDRTAERVAADVRSSLKRAYTQQFQDGLISADQLENQLVFVGFDVDAAHAYRLLQEAISFHPDPTGQTAEEKLHARELQTALKNAAVEEFRKGIINADDLNAALIDAGIFADVAAAIVETEQARALKPTTSTSAP